MDSSRDAAELRAAWERGAAAHVAWPYSRSEYGQRIAWTIARAFLWPLLPSRLPALRRGLLRAFGAKIGDSFEIKGSAAITFPWNLTAGDHIAVGERAILYNLGSLQLGSYVSISQDAYVCCGTHDHTTPALPLQRPTTTIGSYVWIAAGAFVGPGVTIGDGAVIGARAVVMRDVKPWTIVAGNPAREIGQRTMNFMAEKPGEPQ